MAPCRFVSKKNPMRTSSQVRFGADEEGTAAALCGTFYAGVSAPPP